MELELQPETEFIEVKSPIDRFRDAWAQESLKKGFFFQRNIILKNPDLVQYAELARPRGWKEPLKFGVQGLLVAAFFISLLSWWITKDEGIYADRIEAVIANRESELKTQQGVIDSAEFQSARIETSRSKTGFTVALSTNLTKEEALAQLNLLKEQAEKLQEEYKYNAAVKMQNLRAAGDRLTLLAAGTALMFSLALLFAAPVFARFIQLAYPESRLAAKGDSFYLYYVVSHGVWLNCGLVVLLSLALGRSAYGLSGFFEGIGPIGRIIFWLAVYAVLLHWFFTASKDIYKAMQISLPRDLFGPENKVLLWMHNSFWIVFLVFEAVLGLLAYGVYLLEKAK